MVIKSVSIIKTNTKKHRINVELVSILKTRLTDYVGILSEEKLIELGQSLLIAVGVD